MLYNPRWKRETVADLVAWLETQDPEQRYEFRSCGRCLIARWMRGIDQRGWPPAITLMYIGQDAGRVAVGPKPSPGEYPPAHEWTYGVALTRARAAVTAEAA